MNMLYSKNTLTYSAYIKNMEGFIKNTLGLKKDVKIGNIDRNEGSSGQDSVKKLKNTDKKNLKASDKASSSSKRLDSVANKSPSKPGKLNNESSVNEETHPSLKRRYARLFISVPK